LDAAQSSQLGTLLRRALDLRAALKMGVHLTLDDIAADEFAALVVIEEEQARKEAEAIDNGSSRNRSGHP
jgi:hypothetical protein